MAEESVPPMEKGGVPAIEGTHAAKAIKPRVGHGCELGDRHLRGG